MVAVLVLLLVVLPILEIWVAIQVGQVIGALPTIFLLVGFSVLGAILIKHEGIKAYRRFGEAVDAGRAPGREVLDAMLVLVGGVLMLVPGFVTDAIGLFLILPPTRAGVRWLVWRWVRKRVVVVQPAFVGPSPGRSPPPGGGQVIDVEVLDPPAGETVPPPDAGAAPRSTDPAGGVEPWQADRAAGGGPAGPGNA